MPVYIGGLIAAIWVAFLFEGRTEMRRYERLSDDFLFRWNILPLMVALDLIFTQDIAVLGIGLLAFFLCWPIARLALMLVPVLAGWHIGSLWFAGLYSPNDSRVVVGAVLMALALAMVSQCIVVVMRRPPAHT
jgi:hypothetical protein